MRKLVLLNQIGRSLMAGKVLLLGAVVLVACSFAAPHASCQELDVPTDAKVLTAAAPRVYDIDASGTEIGAVLETLSRASGANIVVGPDVKGEVTARIKQKSVEDILQNLSTVLGFGWAKTGGSYLVASKSAFVIPEEKATEPAPVKIEVLVWDCMHIDSGDMATTVQSLFPGLKIVEGPGSISPDLGASSGVGGSDAGSGSYGGSQGASSGGTSSSSSGAKGAKNKIVLMGPAGDIARARDVLAQLDVPRPQILVKVVITEVNSSANKDLGVNWTFNDIVLKEASSGGLQFGKFNRDPMDFTGAISALISDGRANLLAQPNISVVDGETASILIGDRILFPKLVGYSSTGTPIFDKEEEKVGIYLQIAPRVTSKDEVLLNLYPQVSLVTSFLKTTAGDYPQISTREARTTVSVKSGETLAIGGLLRENDITSAQKVPLFGDLPIIGGMFRHSKKTKERTEIVIFLTPTIVEADSVKGQ
jgi:type II secretory pathway component GspD/PulD (secretin)